MTPEQYARITADLQAHGQDPNGVAGQPVPSEGMFSDAMMGAGQYILDRTPYVNEHTAGMLAPDTTAAHVGAALPGVAIGFAAPGAGVAGMLSQGALAAGQEYLRRGSTGIGAGMEGGLTAAMTGATDLLFRGASGGARLLANSPMGQRVQAAIGRQAEPLIRATSDRLTRLAETWGGLGAINQAQQRAVSEAAVNAVGETGTALTKPIRRAAAERIGAAMDAALPVRPVDVTPAYTVLDDVPAAQFPGKARLLQDVTRAENDPAFYQQAMAGLRKTARKMALDGNQWADEITHGIDALAHAGEDAGAANTRVVREQYKNLIFLEGMNTVRNTGHVPVLAAEQRLQKAYSPGTARRAGEGTLPATQKMFEMIQAGAEEAAARFKSSGSAERATESAALMEAASAAASANPAQSLLRALGPLVGSPLLGAASVGTRSDLAGQAGAAGGRALYDKVAQSQ